MTNDPSDNAAGSEGVKPSPTIGKAPPHMPAVILSSKELLQGAREVWIEHGEEMYRLRLTASGKLLLTK